jgi:hypothetical protein
MEIDKNIYNYCVKLLSPFCVGDDVEMILNNIINDYKTKSKIELLSKYKEIKVLRDEL